MTTCEGCGHDYEQEEMSGVDTLVNLKDGTTREIQFCDVVCFDFWTVQEAAAPGDWAELASGEKVQRAVLTCQHCVASNDYHIMQLLVDTHDYDPDDHYREYNPDVCIICNNCVEAEPGRFKTRREVGI